MSLVATLCGYALTPALLLSILTLVLVQDLLFRRPALDPLIKAACRSLGVVFGISVRVRGLYRVTGRGNRPERVPEVASSGRLFIANHVNIFDPLILFACLPGHVRAVELEGHFSWPVWGTITRRLGNIPISHTNPASAVRSLKMAAEALNRGTSICILPEGHRTRDGSLGVFMRGPFRLALDTGAEIVPMAMRGAFQRKNVHSLRIHPGRVEVVFGRPLSAADFHSRGARQLTDAVRARVAGLLAD